MDDDYLCKQNNSETDVRIDSCRYAWQKAATIHIPTPNDFAPHGVAGFSTSSSSNTRGSETRGSDSGVGLVFARLLQKWKRPEIWNRDKVRQTPWQRGPAPGWLKEHSLFLYFCRVCSSHLPLLLGTTLSCFLFEACAQPSCTFHNSLLVIRDEVPVAGHTTILSQSYCNLYCIIK